MNRPFTLASLVVGSLLATTPATASEPFAPLITPGDYEFESPSGQDGKPACTAHWQVGADGVLVITDPAGPARVKIGEVPSPNGNALRFKAIEGDPDAGCFGRVQRNWRTPDAGYTIYEAKAGHLVLCRIVVTAGGTIVPQPIALLYPSGVPRS